MKKKQAPATLTRNKALKYRWLIFSILSLCYVLVYFHRICPAVLPFDLMRDLRNRREALMRIVIPI